MSKFARKKIRHDEETRNKIQAGVLIDRLIKHVMGEIELSATQVTSAKALLDKVLPNLQATDLNVETDAVQFFASDKPLSPSEYARNHAKGVVDAASGTAIPPDTLPN